MPTRIPASERTSQKLDELLTQGVADGDARAELLKLAVRKIVEEALEAEVADAVSRKLAATQELARKDTEIEIERKERVKREVQAGGIANAMQIIRGQLSALYVQHEAIEAQKQMVNSPNQTVV